MQGPPLGAGEAARLVVVQPRAVFDAFDHGGPFGAVRDGRDRESVKLVVGEAAGGLGVALSATALAEQRGVGEVDTGANDGARGMVGQVLGVVVGGAAFLVGAVEEVQVVDDQKLGAALVECLVSALTEFLQQAVIRSHKRRLEW